MANKNSNRKTAAKMVMDVLKRHDALDPESAITIDYFKNLKLTTAVIGYTIGNLINDGVVNKTGDDRYYFNEAGWKKLEKKVNRGYLILIAVPVVFIIVMLGLRYFFNL
ncbi:putative transcriptional regulator [Breznakia sp. PF5-3]|uniref:hypothetical protein n=1 Tax=unclassified Breznakia TaxID=2623764 RepID=UPI00240649F3|nr:MULTISPECIES: hypothetical protein [unclassified Breznakia]MDF9823817.1 putative transcriptional regulator [Breznakia sp. PM6-1]MDF9834617.1 putative transcriptional regulator [Breznakia sp. PF5-3]MDF9836766.1 putative transcriptional regulator [Breznakia sp. PFB2-8]MDF9858785.1 putative transcriptional regulator [Breznakia sp. PH5-24]